MNIYSFNPSTGMMMQFGSYGEYLNTMGTIAKSKVKTVQNYEGLDDPDTAAKWIRDNIKFYIKDNRYKVSKVKDIEQPTEDSLKEVIKRTDDLNVAQKCWVMELLKGFNEYWMFGGSMTYSEINEYFRPIKAGQFGTSGIDEELIKYMEAV